MADQATTASATIETADAQRYLTQLCKHFQHRLTVTHGDGTGRITFPRGTCTLEADGGSLRLHVAAEAPDALPELEDVVARHLVRSRSEKTSSSPGTPPEEEQPTEGAAGLPPGEGMRQYREVAGAPSLPSCRPLNRERMILAVLGTFAVRYLLVMLFLPFSALDKILNFRGAVAQAAEIAPRSLAMLLILAGLFVEIFVTTAILAGVADRLAGLIMAGYCMVTALLWKQFWKPGDFWQGGDSKGRGLFWDFLKNFSLAGGFLLLVVGAHGGLDAFFAAPLSSSHPYRN